MKGSVAKNRLIRVVFVDDHEIFHDCIRHLFDLQENMQMLATANNGRTAVRLAREHAPEVMVMDISMPGLNGIDATRQILADNPRIKIIALSMHSERQIVQQVLRAGAHGYVLKDCAFDELISAIQVVMQGDRYLSPRITSIVLDDYLRGEEGSEGTELLTMREREVLQLIAEGKTSRQIAEALNLSVKTVESHRAQLLRKLNLGSLADLVKYAVREGLTPLGH